MTTLAAHSPFVTDAATTPIVVMTNVSRVYGQGAREVSALTNVSLAVFPGELVAVMGPSGSGKSTLLTLVGGLDRATSGSIMVEGQQLENLAPSGIAALRRRHVGFVFQDYNLIPSLTAVENVALPLELEGNSLRHARLLACEMMRFVGVSEVADRYPDQMSGGQQQRVAIARSLVGQRRLVLADEPTGALDSHTSEAVMQVLRERCDDGCAVLLVTHEARHAAWADRVIFLRDGRIVDATDPITELETLLSAVPAEG